MHATAPLLGRTDFPPIRRAQLQTLQVNVGYRCNQSCVHCHVSAGPGRTEEMSRETAELCVRFLDASGVGTLDVTGGAPELNPSFRYLVDEAAERGLRVIDRCNLTILLEPGFEDLAEYLAERRVELTASLPCYLEENVEQQRGKGVYAGSIEAIRRLNRLGYGRVGSGLVLNLVYNPVGPVLPPPQAALEADYRRELGSRYGLVFNRLLTLTNLPVGRFGSMLVSKGGLGDYVQRLREAYVEANLEAVMCRSLISVDWRGNVYDCDFNQMMGLGMRSPDGDGPMHLSELVGSDIAGRPIVVRNHCYGCTAGQGSSCGGALT
jgi:radical SAM/Cys-rich protein